MAYWQGLESFPHLHLGKDGCTFEALVGVFVVDCGVVELSVLAALDHEENERVEGRVRVFGVGDVGWGLLKSSVSDGGERVCKIGERMEGWQEGGKEEDAYPTALPEHHACKTVCPSCNKGWRAAHKAFVHYRDFQEVFRESPSLKIIVVRFTNSP